MVHQDRQKINSWYTDSTYNADESYENSPFATDPRTFPAARSSIATSMSYNHPFAMIPLPSQHQLHTIEEMRNESTEACPPETRRLAQSSVLKNEELIEKSLKSISLIRSRLLQQQAANRKKTGEFQQIRSSLDLVHSLVHLVHDETSNKTLVKFSTEDFKVSPYVKNFKLLRVEKDNTVRPNADLTKTFDNLEIKTAVHMHIGPGNSPLSVAKINSSHRSYKAMSTTSNVPTTPTKPGRSSIAGSRKSHHRRSEEDLILVTDPVPTVNSTHRDQKVKPPRKIQTSYYKNQLKTPNPENETYHS